MIPDLPPWTRTPPPGRCPNCLTVPQPGDTHGQVMARDAYGTPLLFCWDDEGRELPADDEAPDLPALDPWTTGDPGQPPPF